MYQQKFVSVELCNCILLYFVKLFFPRSVCIFLSIYFHITNNIVDIIFKTILPNILIFYTFHAYVKLVKYTENAMKVQKNVITTKKLMQNKILDQTRSHTKSVLCAGKDVLKFKTAKKIKINFANKIHVLFVTYVMRIKGSNRTIHYPSKYQSNILVQTK